jgi:solute carrier family 25 (adenine nucleotide translocator) protein 4/5/6/31
MAHQPPASSSGTKSGYGKVLKDFVLGGTSGAIAKTIAAPIERVKLLLQTQMNNPKLAARPYTGTQSFNKRYYGLFQPLCEGGRCDFSVERQLGQRGKILPHPSH